MAMKGTIETIYPYMEKVSGLMDVMGNMLSLVMFLLGVGGIVCFFFLSTKRVNSSSRKKIDELKKNRKYIPELYVELDDTLEVLRYYIYSNFRFGFINAFNWKIRLINEFYAVIGKCFFKKWLCIFFQTKKSLLYNIDINVRKFKYYNRNPQKWNIDPCFPNGNRLERLDSYWIQNRLNNLKKKAEILLSQSVLVVGSAGNGKTNLLCRITEILLKINHKVVYINARNITDNIYDYIKEQLGFFWPFNKLGRRMVLIYIWLCRPFFIVDAINENDNRDFSEKFFAFVDEITARKAKVIISSREEYFKERFLKDIGRMNIKPYLLKLRNLKNFNNENEVLSRSQKTILARYAKAFNVKKPNDFIARQLFQSLLFLRLYFEVYRNIQSPVTSLYRHKIYKKYIDNCIQQYDECSQLKLKQMLDRIPQLMITQGKYDNLKVSDVTDDYESIRLFRRFSDDNFLTSRKIIENKNSITEDETEVISFTFDELRDYCLARSLIKKCDNEKIIEVLESFDKTISSPFEGVVHYVYIDAKENNKLELCQYIFSFVFEPIQYFFNVENQFDWGLEVIFDTGSSLNDLEKNYLHYCLLKKEQLLNASYYFFFQERNNLECKFSDLMNILYAVSDMSDLKKIMKPYCVNQYINGDLYSGHNEQKRHYFLKRLKICHEEKICAGFVELLYMSILLFDGNGSIGYVLESYHDKNKYLDSIVNKTNCDELKILAIDLSTKNFYNFTDDEFIEELENCLNEEE